ncbi:MULTISPECIES: outer membrane beta-barrel protein [Flavobacteriaceae]|uniref:Outer membrane protein beta-barrel domain-containing protein n=2 Tax=Flavobacteriaceae TaxID=49546 RepID=A0A4Y8ATR9_9FLAO|nr:MULTISPECIES: outer membrane beta-barrel protein [Flavobacteriaceae]TEW74076.1 hypothetical protein E2488_11430 [Gramella jeungdoensis]GGK40038.1 hypothetical protein GCM10007963_05200 [Lutibacter litoralis]
MRKNLLLLVAILVVTSASAQFYVSGSGGYAVPSAGVKFGEIISVNGTENTYGSYGEGLNAQFRAGYFFNDTWGVDLGFGYLHGADQTIKDINVPGSPVVDIKARGRAYGLSTSVVYKFTNNIYGRFGALIKVGGKTEALGSIYGVNLPAGVIPNVPIATTLDIDYTQDYKGRLPLGFVGAIGYKHNLSDNFSIFAEAEYMGISVTRDSAEIMEFSATLREVDGATLPIENVQAIFAASGSELAGIFNNEIEFVDELPLGDSNTGSKQLSSTVPYSSFGVNFGITYTFSKK